MANKKNQKVSYALDVQVANRQLKEAKSLINKGISLMELFCCTEHVLPHKKRAIKLLAEYITNNNFYANLLEKHLESENRITNKKSGKENIVVDAHEFDLFNSYVIMTAACENDLELIGISMRSH